MNRLCSCLRGLAVLAASILTLMGAAAAQAGTGLITTPADKFVMAPGGVDMRTGRYAYSRTDLAIGGTDESGGLALTRILQSDVQGHLNPFGNFSHNWDIMVSERRVSINDPSASTGLDYRIMVHFGGRSKTFQSYQSDTGFGEKGNGPYGTLTYVGDRASASVVYTYTAPDGTVAVFRPLGGGDCSAVVRCAYVSSITEADGTVFTFGYDTSGGPAQLRQVTSSRGYALLIEPSNGLIVKACVLNLTQTTVTPNQLCPGNALATANYSYVAGTQRLASATRPGGAVESFTYSNVTSTGLTMGFVKPGQTTPWLTNNVTFEADENWAQQEIVHSQSFADGQSYAYDWDRPPATDGQPNPAITGGSYTDALGHVTIVAWDFPPLPGGAQPGGPCYKWPCPGPITPDEVLNRAYQVTLGPVRIVDPLGRTTAMDYCDPAAEAGLPPQENYRCIVIPMVSFTDPEGIKTDLSYDGALNITRAVRHAKPGTGLPDIVTSATYDQFHPKSHSKPLTTTDANGRTTTYTYAPEHGGVLTETGPAVNNVTPQKRYTYAQRTAWISNGAGGWTAAGPPVWVLTQTSFCKTGNPAGAGCANGASDEVITTYDYGPDSGPNNLILRGTVVDAGGLSLRSCTSYDPLGNKISETKPRAGLTSCP